LPILKKERAGREKRKALPFRPAEKKERTAIRSPPIEMNGETVAEKRKGKEKRPPDISLPAPQKTRSNPSNPNDSPENVKKKKRRMSNPGHICGERKRKKKRTGFPASGARRGGKKWARSSHDPPPRPRRKGPPHPQKTATKGGGGRGFPLIIRGRKKKKKERGDVWS